MVVGRYRFVSVFCSVRDVAHRLLVEGKDFTSSFDCDGMGSRSWRGEEGGGGAGGEWEGHVRFGSVGVRSAVGSFLRTFEERWAGFDSNGVHAKRLHSCVAPYRTTPQKEITIYLGLSDSLYWRR